MYTEPMLTNEEVRRMFALLAVALITKRQPDSTPISLLDIRDVVQAADYFVKYIRTGDII